MNPKSVGRPLITLVALITIAAAGAGCRRDPAAAKARYLESGNRYAAAGKYPEAIIEYRNALQQDSLAGDVREKLAEASLQVGDLGGALREYVRAADLLPADAALQVKAANLLLLAGQFEDAKARAEKVLAQDPRHVDAQIVVANALAGLKDLDGAVRQIEEALRVDPNRSGTYSSLGAIELGRGKREEAERAFQAAVDRQPDSAVAHLALGNFYWMTGQIPAAEQSLLRAIAIDRQNPLINRALANFYLAADRRREAEQPLKIVLEVTKTPAAAFALSEYYVAVGNEAGARGILLPMLSDPRTGSEANVRLAALDYSGGRHTEAYRRLTEVLATDQANLQALLVKSALLLSEKKLEEALASASTAADRHPNSTQAHFMVGRAQVLRRQPDAAISAFQEVLRLNPRVTEAKMALAQLHLEQGRPDTSLGFSQEALANEPGNANAQLLYVRGLLARGELDRADIELKQLAARYPQSASVHTQMGMLQARKQAYGAARTAFERAQQLEPDDVEALGGLVALDLISRNYAAARARVDARLASDPTAVVCALAARTYAASGDLAASERVLRQALELDPAYLPAYAALGQLYVSQGKLPAARGEFEEIIKRSPKNVAAWTMVGVILQTEGDINGARDTFERTLEIDPQAAVAANNLAWIYAEHGGNLDLALQLAQTASGRLPDVAEVHDTLGFIYYKKNLTSLAISTLKVTADKEPSNAMYQFHLGLAYASAGDVTRARQSLTRALTLQPDFTGAQEAQRVLGSLQ
ncbi:MAG: hypothetical protein A3H95_14095 [Acidobacteria bacterium RIFCSPLOWO2_02_FULL_64_15]|nr:MAG: hypothetical protein A3H95_14095 [Acidobacteria bacterium RIFCSPLOWO2_02_FULL_64_15]